MYVFVCVQLAHDECLMQEKEPIVKEYYADMGNEFSRRNGGKGNEENDKD